MINPIIKSTTGSTAVHGDEVDIPMMRNPYAGTPHEGEFENGYEYAQELGHMNLGQATPEDIARWQREGPAWRSGFETATSRLGLKNISDQIQKQASTEIKPMPYHISHSGGSFKVIGPFKGKPGHVYGTHGSEEGARAQQKALYANTKEACWATEYMKTAFMAPEEAQHAELGQRRRGELMAGLLGGGLGAATLGLAGGALGHAYDPSSANAPIIGEIGGGVLGSNIGRYLALREVADKPDHQPSLAEIAIGTTPTAAPAPVPQIAPMPSY